MLDDVKREVFGPKKKYEDSWELFRVVHFPGREHEQAAAELGAWCRKNGIEPKFKTININKRLVIRVVLRPR
jgi:hypothetical protein